MQKVRGTGLGLPLSRNLAELPAAALSVTSELGLGSTFSFAHHLVVIDNQTGNGFAHVHSKSRSVCHRCGVWAGSLPLGLAPTLIRPRPTGLRSWPGLGHGIPALERHPERLVDFPPRERLRVQTGMTTALALFAVVLIVLANGFFVAAEYSASSPCAAHAHPGDARSGQQAVPAGCPICNRTLPGSSRPSSWA